MTLLEEAKALQKTLLEHRRYIHQNAEVGMDLPLTSSYVKKALTDMGYTPELVGSSGLTATVGPKGRTFLLRADMDALPILEENELEFISTTGNMHACGHDLHTAMLLGAAQLLKNHEGELKGQVKLMFQPGEEILAGAQSMIEHGVLENPAVDAAMMIHVAAGVPLLTGCVLFLDQNFTFAASDTFRIEIQGKGGHGAMPDFCIDPLNIMARLHLALQSIVAREAPPAEKVVLTVGQMQGGSASNVIPDTCFMTGTIRTMENTTREFIKNRVVEMASAEARMYRGSAGTVYERGCPSMKIDEALKKEVMDFTAGLLGKDLVFDHDSLPPLKSGLGSEDFSYVSQKVPATGLILASGTPDDGYAYPIHHPKVLFDENVLSYGAAINANAAIQWLEKNS